ncbi:MAG: hypothetical protein A4E65_00220 [Syntrophorhabdus sp. PtaU1.Bin153]|nr:MAG: hypothetical protein A4E65_00220 [Syntrophorhabdus sp. PtaU1.Bin153]
MLTDDPSRNVAFPPTKAVINDVNKSRFARLRLSGYYIDSIWLELNGANLAVRPVDKNIKNLKFHGFTPSSAIAVLKSPTMENHLPHIKAARAHSLTSWVALGNDFGAGFEVLSRPDSVT